MKKIVIPEPIDFTKTEELKQLGPVSFALYVEMLLDQDPRANTTAKSSRLAAKVLEKISTAKPGESVELEDAHYDFIKPIVLEPDGGQPTATITMASGQVVRRALGRRLLPFLDAVEEAK